MSDSEAKITITGEDKLSPVVKEAAKNFQNLQGTLKDGASSMKEVGSATEEASKPALNIVKYWEQQQQAVDKLNPAFREHVNAVRSLSGEEESLAQHMQEVESGAEPLVVRWAK